MVVVPLWVAITSSLKDNTEIYSDPLGIRLGSARWENFPTALRGPTGGLPLWHYFGNSVLATSLGTLLGSSLGAMAGYGLARAAGGLSSALARIMTVLLTIPTLATLVPIFNMMGTFGLRDNAAAISLVYAAFMVPGTAVLMSPYFASIPTDLLEAARLDGAGEARIFLGFVIPLSIKALLGVVMINLIWVWSELQLASVLLVTGSSRTLPVGLVGFQGEYQTDLGVQAAGLLIAAAPVVFMYFLFSRRITEGMQVGVLK